MNQYKTEIKDFIEAHFTESDPDRANFRRGTQDLLKFLWLTFPVDCISDYDLNQILSELGHTRHVWVQEFTTTTEKEDRAVTTISKVMVNGWCLMSVFDLKDDVFTVPKLTD
nr:hypothetical protein [uncultured Flavobacterium sp.]